MTPLFLLSLPRSGSTLLQRLLAAHPAVSTASEPWMLLPLLSLSQGDPWLAPYSGTIARQAISEFLEEPTALAAYRSGVQALAEGVYEARSDAHARFFIDKTPRYHFVLDELRSTFPDAKFLFLWRNPLAVAASLIESFGRGRWNIFKYERDLFGGLDRLVAFSTSLQGDPTRHLTMQYEDLVQRPSQELHRVCSWMGLEYDPSMLAGAASPLEGRMGDKRGAARYTEVSEASLDGWPGAFAARNRRRWARKYARWIGDGRLRSMGYEIGDVLSHLESQPIAQSRPDDYLLMVLGFGYKRFGASVRAWMPRGDVPAGWTMD